MKVVGVLSDTHVPDVQQALPARLPEVLLGRRVDAILHAGDICSPRVLPQLERIAPVYAVRGNRDILWPRNWRLPSRRTLEFDGVRVGIVHGHPPLLRYVRGRLAEVVTQRSRGPGIDPRDLRPFTEDVRVVVYGHDHIPNVQWIGRTMFLNPGTASNAFVTDRGPTVAVLRIDGEAVSAEILSLA